MSADETNCSRNITVTSGLLSGQVDFGGQRYLQTEASLNSGVSGGPALNLEGEVVGLAVSGISPEFAENVGFLVPSGDIGRVVSAWDLELASGTMEPPIEGLLAVNNFYVDVTGDFSSLVLVGRYGAEFEILTSTPGTMFCPHWSPTGREIAYVRGPSTETRLEMFGSGELPDHAIVVVDAISGEERVAATMSAMTPPPPPVSNSIPTA